MPTLKYQQLVTVGTTGKTVANQWLHLIDKQDPSAILKGIDPATIKRVMVQLRGGPAASVVNGNLYLSPDAVERNQAGTDTTGVQLAAPAPAAGPTYPVSFIDEVPCNHQGSWSFLADTTGLIFWVGIWI